RKWSEPANRGRYSGWMPPPALLDKCSCRLAGQQSREGARLPSTQAEAPCPSAGNGPGGAGHRERENGADGGDGANFACAEEFFLYSGHNSIHNSIAFLISMNL